jgi:hypothetical protein
VRILDLPEEEKAGLKLPGIKVTERLRFEKPAKGSCPNTVRHARCGASGSSTLAVESVRIRGHARGIRQNPRLSMTALPSTMTP